MRRASTIASVILLLHIGGCSSQPHSKPPNRQPDLDPPTTNPQSSATTQMATLLWPTPHSDVPVTRDIGWYCYQRDMTITGFTVETVGATHFGLFSDSRTLVRIHILGTLQNDRGITPYISKVQLSEFFESPTTKDGDMVADVVVTP